MTITDVDEVLAQVREPARTTLQIVRARVLAALPAKATVEECISYGIPTIKADGKAVAGFAANTKWCSYYPFSGRILAHLADRLSSYSQTKSALHFPHDAPLSKTLVTALVKARLAEIHARNL